MVEWKKLGEVCKTITPPKKLEKELYGVDGAFPIIDQGQKDIVGYTNDETSLVPNDEYILFGDHTRYVKYFNGSFAQGADGLKILKAAKGILPRYFFFSFENVDVPSRGYSRHWSIAKELIIPIPSLEEQARIVGILDTFTSAIDNLKEQIAQRRKQYEYYRCRLFSTENWTEIKIGKLTKVFSCPRVFKDQWQDSGVPFWRSSDIMSYHNGVINPRGEVFISQSLYNELSSKSDKIKEGDILVTGGGSIGIPYLKKDNRPLFVKDADLICIQKCSSIIPKYLYHYFLSTDFKMYLMIITHDATIAHYTINQIKDTPIPVPPLSDQQRIVSILDTFEASIQNLEAQLKEREKQYEYYRNKLLTFD